MRILLLLMGFVLTSGFFAHDVHYTIKFIGIGLTSIVFLAGLFWFHILVFLKESRLAIVNSAKARNTIHKLRLIIFGLTALSCVAEHYSQLGVNHFISVKNVAECVISFILILFPEIIFRLLFCLKRKKSTEKQKKIAVIKKINPIRSSPCAKVPAVPTPAESITRIRG